MELIYPPQRPSLQRSDSDPRTSDIKNNKNNNKNDNLFYPYVKNVQIPKKVGRFTIEPTPQVSPHVQKVGRFTIKTTPQDSFTLKDMSPQRIVGFNKFKPKSSKKKSSKKKSSKKKSSKKSKSKTLKKTKKTTKSSKKSRSKKL